MATPIQQLQQGQQNLSVMERKLLAFDNKLNTFLQNLNREIKVSEQELAEELTKEQQKILQEKQALQSFNVVGLRLQALTQSAHRFANELRTAGQLIIATSRASGPAKLNYINGVKNIEQNLTSLEGPLTAEVIAIGQELNLIITSIKTELGTDLIAERLGQAAMKNVRAGLTDTNNIIAELGAIKTGIIEQNKLILAELNIWHRKQYGTQIS